nr:MAG TPA: minor capsid protein [Caudoviricetes sp.]
MLQSDELTQSRAYQIQYQKALKAQIEAILDKLQGDEFSSIQDYLSHSYTEAYVGTMYGLHGQGIPIITPIDQRAAVKAVVTDSKLSTNLYAALGYDMDKLKKHVREEITRGLASSLPYDQIARNVSMFSTLPLANAKRIVRTEGHRIQQASTEDARQAAKAKGADVVKQWDASLDGKTRPLHRALDGQIRETDEPFEVNGIKVNIPGAFGDPSQDCNCRCVALTRARAALDADELATLKQRAEFFGLDKTESFEDFKKKYMKAAESVENTGKSGIIRYEGKRKLAIPQMKLSGYALNPQKAPDKAAAFEKALGYTLRDAETLVQDVLDHLDDEAFIEKGDAGHGMRYEQILLLTGLNGKQANVLTAWIDDGNGGKRMTSIYVTKRRPKE